MNAQELKRALEDSVRPTVTTGGKRQSCSSGISTLWSALYQRFFVELCHTIGILLPVGSRRLRLVQQLLKMPAVYRIHGWQAVWHEAKVALVLLLGVPGDFWRVATRGIGMRLPEFSAKPLKKHRAMVDVIVYGSDARDQLQHCVSQIIAHTTPRYRLIVAVDTASSDAMAYLREVEESQGVVLCEATGVSDRAQAVATALHAARAPLAVVLHSSVTVTTGWLDRLIRCVEASRRIVAVAPVTNLTIAELSSQMSDVDRAQYADARAGEEVARIIAHRLPVIYPRRRSLSGTCFLCKRAALDKMTIQMSAGGGVCLTVSGPGCELAVAADTYLFDSYAAGDVSRMAQSKPGRATPPGTARDGMATGCYDRVMDGVGLLLGGVRERYDSIRAGMRQYEGRRIGFLVSLQGVSGCGHVIIQEVAAMRRMGVDARIINLRQNQPLFERDHPGLDVPVLNVDNPATDIDYSDYDGVIATYAAALPRLREIIEQYPATDAGYYILEQPPACDRQMLTEAFTAQAERITQAIPLFVKSGALQAGLREIADGNLFNTGAGVDMNIFHPRPATRTVATEPVRLLAMIRPREEQHQAGLTMRVLSRLAARYGSRIEIHLFGCSEIDPDFLCLERNFEYTNWGIIDRATTARLMSSVDIFVDFTRCRKVGLAVLEAMASGLAVVVLPEEGQVIPVRHEHNALVIESCGEADCCDAVARVVEDLNLRETLQREAIRTAYACQPENSARIILRELLRQPDGRRESERESGRQTRKRITGE